MGLLDWLFPRDLLSPRDRRKVDEGSAAAYAEYMACCADAADPYPDITGEQWSNLLKLLPQEARSRRIVSAMPGMWTTVTLPAPRQPKPRETHKTRMAALIERRNRTQRAACGRIRIDERRV